MHSGRSIATYCENRPGGSLGTVFRDGEAGRNVGDKAEPAGMHSGRIAGNDNVCNVDPDPSGRRRPQRSRRANLTPVLTFGTLNLTQ